VDFITKGPALTASRLAGKKLCIIFADGYTQVPMEFRGEDGKPAKRFGPCWMSPAQEQALEEFVLAGGSFMPVHNSSARTACALLAAESSQAHTHARARRERERERERERDRERERETETETEREAPLLLLLPLWLH
jgi:hypothetical protein